MDKKKSQDRQVVYAFIDSQNLNLGVRNDIRTADGKHFRYKGWNLDFGKFYEYLRSDLHVQKAFIFIGYMPDNQELYDALKQDGFELIYKPILEILNKEATDIKIKGNIDAEMVLHAMINYQKYDKAIIVSGDGDFFCLEEYLEQNGKLGKIIVPNKWNYSSLIEKYSSYFITMSDLRKKLSYTRKKQTDRPKKEALKETASEPSESVVAGDGKGPKYFGM
ncbi:TPA: hypothetical protein DIU27_04815 [Candidatus Collierbacteria bacterium]|uniref:NYN domain-containing protein n=1 Tax=Candidatus Collierbacteria bacterium GW2011_GWB2_44_22 TaxID=1618387 RepID=A0A0G1K4L9_9BACT|nr:MAG: hypothetical protein UW31_C0002G0004 [Candidatus Collierbacteria bacterium GW2011_GWA2_44_13]KKT48912.1 MAG: hypothetical protein UW42_C0044G0007 [Candidatus Collierbacteria bacterium GW2011_GWB1_44_197]KKT51212.1 MAG: hypothetical protein UW44_C0014G0004 [Candidatus Collierbacteria bacterium GW2011_GWB2_44_22]KKT62172.1 MAG: hypothetical protein UW56_C0010G0004 [Candidatus Collierbacteria bacterium GW2011_GWD1_44_27]KKT65677.1 MAG: hypothetical protein UW58_C0023G0020 [Candidatus Colli